MLVLQFLQGEDVPESPLVSAIDIRLLLPVVAVLTQLVSIGTTQRLAATARAEAERAEADHSKATLRHALDSGLDAETLAKAAQKQGSFSAAVQGRAKISALRTELDRLRAEREAEAEPDPLRWRPSLTEARHEAEVSRRAPEVR